MRKKQQKISAKEKFQQRLFSLNNAIQSLKDIHKDYLNDPSDNKNELALIQMFSITFELSWKTLKYYIEYQEMVSISFARDIIRQAFHKDIIQDGQLWITMLEDRNQLVHIYDREMAKVIAQKISDTYIPCIEKHYQEMEGLS